MNQPELTQECVLDEAGISGKIRELASSILEACRDDPPAAFIGIYTRGVTLAQRIQEALKEPWPDMQLGTLDISLYRDDLDNLGSTPVLRHTDIPFDIEGARIILFDEVIFTGRTIRAALHELIDFGRPSRIELAVLVDRGNRELPIQPDYVALTLDTTMREYVKVRFQENDDKEGVFLLRDSSK